MRIPWITALRAVVAIGVLVSAAVHLYIYVKGFSAIPVIGLLFLANVVGGVAIAATVALWRHWIPAFLAAGFGLTTVVAYWISVIHGLFGVKEVTGGWPEIVAETAEYAAIVFGAVAAIALRRHRFPHPAKTSAQQNPARNSQPAAPATNSGMPQAGTSAKTMRQTWLHQ